MVTLNTKTKKVAVAAFLLAFFTFLSRVLGMFRNNLLGNIFPAEKVDIYLAAFRIPDLVYGLLITGGIVAAFLPVFSSYFKKSDKESKLLVRNVFTVFLFSLIIVSAILALFAPQLAKLVVPGFNDSQRQETVALMRIMFLSPLLLGVSAIVSGVLQYFHLFLAYALAPIFYNLGIIFGILFLAPKYGLKGIAFGVVLGALFHLLIQIPPFLKKGFSLRPFLDLKSSGLKKIFSLMIPRTIGSACHHFNLIVLTAIASTLVAGSIMVFNFSQDLYGVPLGLIGISFAVASFPSLSRNFADRDKKEFLKNVSSSFSRIFYIALPMSVLMFIFRAQVVRLLYGTRITGEGYFTWASTRLTAASLGLFTLSVFSACLIPFLARVFYSFHNTKTPVKISVLSFTLNIILSLVFVFLLKGDNLFRSTLGNILKVSDIKDIAILALPLALSISSIFNFILLIIALKRKMKTIVFSDSLFKVIVSSGGMGVLAYFSLRVFAFNTETVLGILLQLSLSSIIAVVSYILFSFLLKCPQSKAIWLFLKKR